MKRLASLLFLMLGVLTASAQVNLVLNMKDGSKIVKYISDIDSISFDVKTTDLVGVSVSDADKIRSTSAQVDVVASGVTEGITELGVCYSPDAEKVNVDEASKVSYSNLTELYNILLKNLSLGTTYYYKGYVKFGDEYIYSPMKSFTTLATDFPAAKVVDLGLSVKWASWNVGAFDVSDYGSYIGWGDSTAVLRSTAASDYANDNTATNIAGTKFDVATHKWGGKWRMPTTAEIEELNSLEWSEVSVEGVNCWMLTAKNGNYIYIPKAGFQNSGGKHYVGNSTYLWSSEIDESQVKPKYANCDIPQSISIKELSKNVWLSVRPVYDENATEPENPDTPKDERAVDLGLSVKWASYNIGATKASEAGDYYAWAETETKTTYTTENCRYYESKELGDEIGGTDNDVAHVKWGSTWRMPSIKEVRELVNNCTWTWTTQDGVNGYKVTSKTNGNSIFLPAAGYMNEDDLLSYGERGYYFSSYNYTPRNDAAMAYDLEFNHSSKEVTYNSRSNGLTIRAVMP